ncbi:MAG: divalent-cation tolerance protein CutA [Ottowia sp.]|nr:divalent-cation tolerance protein CutA [Ottowia sp.]
MSELVLVATHLPDHEQAQRAARRMIRTHLAASAQIAPTEKIYYWHGQWSEVQKWVLALMTTKARYPALEAALRALHADGGEPPPIFAIPCTAALPVYADWVRDKVLESESAGGVRPPQVVNFPDSNPPSSLPPEE